MYRTTGKPSAIVKKDHIWAFREGYTIPEQWSYDVGKWLVFEQAPTVDRVWELIRQAIAVGKLGMASKVATKGTALTSASKDYLICVYSEDYHDKTEVLRILAVLKELSITVHSYKTNQKCRRMEEFSRMMDAGVPPWEIPKSSRLQW